MSDPDFAADEEILKGAEERAGKATAGPWIWEDWSQDDGPNEFTLTAPPETCAIRSSLYPDLRNSLLTDEDREVSSDDRDFIAAARTDIPALAAIARKYQRALVEYRAAALGFADAVRLDTGKAYPWPALDLAEEQVRRILEGGKE